MIPLDTSSIEQSESMGDESEVRVRVFPRWTPGILVGKVGKKADEMSFNFGDATLKSTEYWRRKHGINFVKSDDEMLKVHIPLFGQTLPYPWSCIFQEFKKKSPLPEDLKKVPQERVDSSSRFVKDYLNQISFLGLGHEFEGPLSPISLGYTEYSYPPQSTFQVLVGSGISVPVNGVHTALRRYGPYSGKSNGKFIVVHSGNEGPGCRQNREDRGEHLQYDCKGRQEVQGRTDCNNAAYECHSQRDSDEHEHQDNFRQRDGG